MWSKIILILKMSTYASKANIFIKRYTGFPSEKSDDNMQNVSNKADYTLINCFDAWYEFIKFTLGPRYLAENSERIQQRMFEKSRQDR